ncbi:spondin domain-containing protein [Epibacterium ulvae]|uniref:spondin domain-containing protein n=1 Tax=Epibacterium ulvae TaxID=1156985 RepID=UPI00248F47CB|nr:spondin domain-containing protein [Epibacterium ulvae]
MTEIRISVQNTSAEGGTALTPFWFAAHDEGFRVYTRDTAASEGLEALAEDGNFAPINAEVTAFDADAVTGAVLGARGPIGAQETTSARVSVDGTANPYLSLAAMILPSNDAFVGTGTAVRLFDDEGNFIGAQSLTFEGSDVLDAGTEVNTEEDAAFINQTAPNTGVDENGVVTDHPGFLPEGEGSILGGTNAFGEFIDPVAADFTQPGAQIAEIHINEVAETELASRDRFFIGSDVDDIVTGNSRSNFLQGRDGWDEISGGGGSDRISGGRGNDLLEGDSGNDILFGGSGNDSIAGGTQRDFLFGGQGNDALDGGDGNDLLFGGNGNDALAGGAGRDVLKGGRGDDALAGGAGNDVLVGGSGADQFIFATGDDNDQIRRFNVEDDTLVLNVEGIESVADVVDSASTNRFGVVLDFGDGDSLELGRINLSDLSDISYDFG